MGGQKNNQTVSAAVTAKAVALKLTSLLALTLTVGEALVVARAASVATITNVTVSIRRMPIDHVPKPSFASGKLDHI